MEPRMARRDFIAGSLAATAAAGLASTTGKAAEVPPGEKRQVYEMRLYSLKAGDMVRRADEYFEHALIPALAGRPPDRSVSLSNRARLTRRSSTTYSSFTHRWSR